MAKICVVHMWKREISRDFIAHSQQALQKVKRADTEITIKPVQKGSETHSQHSNLYGMYLEAGEIIERILEAEREGFDAVVLSGTMDKYLGVLQARSLVNIPVVSPIEAAMHLACMLGRKFAIVALGAPYLRPFTENIIFEHGLCERAVTNPVRFITSTHAEVGRAMGEPSLVMPQVLETSRKCVKDGAEVIIVIGTNLGIICTLAGIASFDVDGREVPLLDPLAVGLKTAEVMADLRSKLGLPPVSRVGMHQLVAKEDFKGVRAAFGLKND